MDANDVRREPDLKRGQFEKRAAHHEIARAGRAGRIVARLGGSETPRDSPMQFRWGSPPRSVSLSLSLSLSLSICMVHVARARVALAGALLCDCSRDARMMEERPSPRDSEVDNPVEARGERSHARRAKRRAVRRGAARSCCGRVAES